MIMRKITVFSKDVLSMKEVAKIKDIYKTANNPKEALIATFPRYHAMNDNMIFLDGLGDKERNTAIQSVITIED